ncbi:hypothetical protein FGO68_gene14765 [Halteria grandinella]|uniref:Uncharacterized protein n=1 Tax=Halteria grandinella TaxID=5974 RepID=A0A8J8T1T0_HALGN|nr:hypothetical protein FGO68_gene14765 [Halteria grandinella]
MSINHDAVQSTLQSNSQEESKSADAPSKLVTAAPKSVLISDNRQSSFKRASFSQQVLEQEELRKRGSLKPKTDHLQTIQAATLSQRGVHKLKTMPSQEDISQEIKSFFVTKPPLPIQQEEQKELTESAKDHMRESFSQFTLQRDHTPTKPKQTQLSPFIAQMMQKQAAADPEQEKRQSLIQQIREKQKRIEEVKAFISEQQAKIEKYQRLNNELEEELQDVNEIVEEKISGKTQKKRESSDRLEQATKIYHDELFLSEGYLQSFLAMRNLIIKYPTEPSEMSIENFKLELVYQCQASYDFLLPLRLRLISRDLFTHLQKSNQFFVKLERAPSSDDDDISLVQDPSLVEQPSSSSQDDEDKRYIALAFQKVGGLCDIGEIIREANNGVVKQCLLQTQAYYPYTHEYVFDYTWPNSPLKAFLDSVIASFEKSVEALMLRQKEEKDQSEERISMVPCQLIHEARDTSDEVNSPVPEAACDIIKQSPI